LRKFDFDSIHTGHFNTVGSVEGWAPQSFVSSRTSRAEQKAQTTQDFMDDEDGLLGGALHAKEAFDTFSTATLQRLQRVTELGADGSSAIPGPMPGELVSIAPSARPIGYKLLQQVSSLTTPNCITAHQSFSSQCK